MNDFEKEKQAFNEWYNGNTDDSWFFVNNTNCLDKTRRVLYGFYGGYHSHDEEITRLRAEIERMEEALQKISDHVDIRLELYKCNRDTVYGLQSIAVQALKSKEESDGRTE